MTQNNKDTADRTFKQVSKSQFIVSQHKHRRKGQREKKKEEEKYDTFHEGLEEKHKERIFRHKRSRAELKGDEMAAV